MGSGLPSKIAQSNTDSYPLKFTKLQSQHLLLGHHRHASETLFKCRSAGGLMVVFGPPPLIKLKENVIKLAPPLTKLSGSAFALCIFHVYRLKTYGIVQ